MGRSRAAGLEWRRKEHNAADDLRSGSSRLSRAPYKWTIGARPKTRRTACGALLDHNGLYADLTVRRIPQRISAAPWNPAGVSLSASASTTHAGDAWGLSRLQPGARRAFSAGRAYENRTGLGPSCTGRRNIVLDEPTNGLDRAT